MLITTLRYRALVLLTFVPAVFAQLTQSSTAATANVAGPKLVRFSGCFHPASGQTPATTASATLSIYDAETGGTALWHEIQNIALDREGHYSVLVGSTQAAGLPFGLFTSGQARWLGVQFDGPGEVEQPRVLMASVPYALKAADASSLGGIPASAFVLAPSATSNASSTPDSSAETSTMMNLAPRASSGAAGFIGKFANSADLNNSAVFDNVGKVGLGATVPLDFMHVKFSNTNGAFTGYAVQNLGNTNTSYSGMLFFDQNGAVGQFQGFNNVTHEYRINNVASGPSINFMLNGTSEFFISSAGQIGIGTTAPKASLQVASGDVLVSP